LVGVFLFWGGGGEGELSLPVVTPNLRKSETEPAMLAKTRILLNVGGDLRANAKIAGTTIT
jgi:hypothetical protein